MGRENINCLIYLLVYTSDVTSIIKKQWHCGVFLLDSLLVSLSLSLKFSQWILCSSLFSLSLSLSLSLLLCVDNLIFRGGGFGPCLKYYEILVELQASLQFIVDIVSHFNNLFLYIKVIMSFTYDPCYIRVKLNDY